MTNKYEILKEYLYFLSNGRQITPYHQPPGLTHHLQPDFTGGTTVEGQSLKGRNELLTVEAGVTGLIFVIPRSNFLSSLPLQPFTEPRHLVTVSLPIFSQKLPRTGLYPGVSFVHKGTESSSNFCAFIKPFSRSPRIQFQHHYSRAERGSENSQEQQAHQTSNSWGQGVSSGSGSPGRMHLRR